MRSALLAIILAVSSCAHQPAVKTASAFSASDTQAITDVITKQAAAWNRGDLAGYMDGYAKLDTLVFTSGGKVNKGWQTTYDRFKKRYGSDTSTMGKLSFTDLEVTPVGADGAIALGTWALETSGRSAGGVFTLAFERRPEGWKIIHDHTSSTDKAASSETGMPECDEYIRQADKLASCDKLPEAARAAMKDGMVQMKQMWKTLAEGDRKGAAEACKQAVDAIKQSASAMGC